MTAGPPPTTGPGPPGRGDGPAALVTRGLAAAWERHCRQAPHSSLYRHDGLVVAVGDPGGRSAAAVLVERAPADPARALEVAEGLAAAHASPVAVDLPAGLHPDVEGALRRGGFQPGLRRPSMVADLGRRSPTLSAGPAAGVRLRPATVADTAGPAAGVRLRPATVADAAALQGLEVACFGTAPAAAARSLAAAVLADPTWWTVVADDGAVRAKAHGQRHPGGLGVLGVATAPAARGRGLASALVGELLARAARAGIGRAWLVADPGAVDLYRRLGFEPAGEWVTWARP